MSIFHYPPDVFNLLVDTIPKINKTKIDVILFFKGAGVPDLLISPLEHIVRTDRKSIDKYTISRQILEAINLNMDIYLKARREIIQRVCDFNAFDTCYENDRYKAKANVAEIKNIVNIKDSVTKLRIHSEEIRHEHRKRKTEEAIKIQNAKSNHDKLKSRFNSLFSMSNHVARGNALEPVLNDMMAYYKISLVKSFRVVIDGSTLEQIDGVIAFDGQAYLVEMKWEKEPIGTDALMKLFGRVSLRYDVVGGILISASSFTNPAFINCNDMLLKKSMALVDLQDVYQVLDQEKDLLQYLRERIQISHVRRVSDIKQNISLLNNIDYAEI